MVAHTLHNGLKEEIMAWNCGPDQPWESQSFPGLDLNVVPIFFLGNIQSPPSKAMRMYFCQEGFSSKEIPEGSFPSEGRWSHEDGLHTSCGWMPAGTEDTWGPGTTSGTVTSISPLRNTDVTIESADLKGTKSSFLPQSWIGFGYWKGTFLCSWTCGLILYEVHTCS